MSELLFLCVLLLVVSNIIGGSLQRFGYIKFQIVKGNSLVALFGLIGTLLGAAGTFLFIITVFFNQALVLELLSKLISP